MTETVSLAVRADVPKEQTWDSESVYADADAWRVEFADVKAALPALGAYAGTLTQGAARLIDWMETSSQMRRRVSKLYFYAAMSAEVDSGNETAREMVGQVNGLYAEFLALTAFQNPELLAIGKSTLEGWINADSRLKVYAQALDNLFRQQPYVRSAEIEELLGKLSDPFGTVRRTYGELTNADMVFPDAADSQGNPVPVTQSSLGSALQSPDRALRRSAWESYADTYLAHKNTLASNYIASIKQTVLLMRTRGYSSSLESALFPDAIPVEVFHTLIETYKKHLPVWHRYWDVKRRAMKLDTFHPYDIWSPIVAREPEVSFEQAVDWIGAGMKPLGEQYVSVLRRGCLEQRWIDRSVNRGKRQGAFSYGTYDTHPFIMMSYHDSLKAMSTLAHELGHSMHSYLSCAAQPEIYSDYTLFVAETASNFNQAMTRAYLFEAKKDDRDFQIALIEEAMSNFHRYFFIMPTLARFELEVHTRIEQGKPVTADILNGILSDYYDEGYGTTMTDDRERTGITWAQFGHLYRPFYTFQYATGISAAHALSADILAGKPGAAENYLNCLSAGGALYSLDALKLAGVDMRSPEPIEKTFGVLESMVDRLEKLTT